MKRLIGVAGVIALLCACSDDSTPDKKDTKVTTKKDGKVGLEPTPAPDLGKDITVKKDTVAVKKDTAPSTACTAPMKATVNSGKPCKVPADCPTGELCVGLKNAGTSVGMCLGKCCMDENKNYNDPENLCPVPDAAKQMAACLVELTSGAMTCGWLCEWTDPVTSQLMKKDCPNATDYDCITIYTNSDWKYCVPKVGVTTKDGGPAKEASTPAKEASTPAKEAGTTKDLQVTH